MVVQEKEYGLIQWSYGRRTQLENYARAMGKDWSDVDLQLDFLWMEISGEPAADGNRYADAQFMYGQKPIWENAETVEEATIAFEKGFERAGTPMMDNRTHWANIYYNQYQGTYTQSTQVDPEVNGLEGVLFIGDSITQGLSQNGGITDNGVQFKGVVSSDATDWLNNQSVGGVPTYSSLPEDSDSIKAICIMLGTNDVGSADSMQALLEKLHEKYPNKMIYVQKILPLSNYDVEPYNSQIENFCNQNSGYFTFIDATNGVTLADGVHPTPDGYKTLANNIRNSIQSTGGIGTAQGFQGTIRIRRVTPNKNIGQIKNTGKGSSTTTSNTTDNSGVGDYITNNAISGTWSVYAKNLFTNQEKVNINNRKMKSASLIKLFIMATVYGEISEQRIKKEDVIDDIKAMISSSNNPATNRLIDKLGADGLGFSKINSYAQGIGCTSTEINRKMLEQSTHGDNYTSVRDVGKLLELIYRGKCVSEEASEEMLEILKTQTIKNKIPAGVPTGVDTANKTGELYEGSKVENDAAIVFKENAPYILVIMSNDISDNDAAVNNIKEISTKVYNTINLSSSSDSGTHANAAHKIAIVPGHGSTSNSGTYEEILNRTKWYTYGAEGTTASGETLKEWKLTKKVADYVERYLSSYADISIVQVGYSSPNWERMQLAKNKGVDAYVAIHFDSSTDTNQSGVSAYYKNGDSTSKSFANIFANSVSQSMGLNNKGVQDDSNTNDAELESIGNSSQWGFPSVLIKGGFMSSSSDMAIIGADNEEGLKKYAQGIANGILEHYNIENTGTGDVNLTNSTTDTYSAVDSKVYDLKYVSPEKFDNYVDNNDRQSLNVYTLEQDTKKLIVANWSFKTGEGIKITKSNPINFRSVVNKYTMPIEYMIAFLVHSDDPQLVSDLADLAINSEFIIAIQDNVTTVETVVDYQEKTYLDVKYFRSLEEGWYSQAEEVNDWHTVGKSTDILETVSNDIELTYADTWFVKFYKEQSYSTISFDSSAGNNLVADQGELIGNYKITTYCSACNSSADTASGNVAKANRTIAVHKKDYEKNNGPLSKGSKVLINGQVYTVEDIGDTNNIQPDNWIDIYIQTENGRCVCNQSSLNSNSTPVYKAQNVGRATNDNLDNNSSNNNIDDDDDVEIISISDAEFKNTNMKGLNTTSSVTGKVTDTTTVTEKQLDTIRVEYDRGMQTHVTERKIITTVRTVTNKYDSGIENVEDNSQKFIDIFLQSKCVNQFNVDWVAEFLQQSEKTVNMIDLTKYLYNKAKEQKKNLDNDSTYNFDVYKVNDLTKIYRSTGILEEYLKSLENNALRLYMNNHISYLEGHDEQEVEKYVTLSTEDPKYKIFSNDEGGWGFGYNIFHKPNETEWDSGIIEHYKDIGVNNIKSYVEEGMEIEADVVDQVMRAEIEKWKEVVEESLSNNGLELEDYQKDALVVIAYTYGWSEQDTKSFKKAYEDYYARDKKDEFREKFTIAQGTEKPLYMKENADNDKQQKQNEKKQSIWYLFDTGNYRTLEGEILDPDSFNGFGSTELLGAAEEIWKIVCQKYTTYGPLGNVPPLDSQRQIDCSGYVSWVLYQYGVNTRDDALVQEFQDGQHNTESLKSVNWESMGFEVIPVAAGQDVRNILKPGDILDRSVGTGSSGHVNICVDVTENGNVLVYDCGGKSHWLGKNGDPCTNTSFAASKSWPGIIIRKK